MGISYNRAAGFGDRDRGNLYARGDQKSEQKYQNESAIKEMVTNLQGAHAANVAKIHEAGATEREKMNEDLKKSQAEKNRAEASESPAKSEYYKGAGKAYSTQGDINTAQVPMYQAVSQRAGAMADENLRGKQLENVLRSGELMAGMGKIFGGKGYIDQYNASQLKAGLPEMGGSIGEVAKGMFGGDEEKARAAIDVAQSPEDLKKLAGMKLDTPSAATPSKEDTYINPITGNPVSTDARYAGTTSGKEAIGRPLIDPIDLAAGGMAGPTKNLFSKGLQAGIARFGGGAAGEAIPMGASGAAGEATVSEAARLMPGQVTRQTGYASSGWTPPGGAPTPPTGGVPATIAEGASTVARPGANVASEATAALPGGGGNPAQLTGNIKQLAGQKSMPAGPSGALPASTSPQLTGGKGIAMPPSSKGSMPMNPSSQYIDYLSKQYKY